MTFAQIAVVACSSVLGPQAQLSSIGLQGDLKIMRRAYEELHPGIYRYNSPSQLGAHWKSLESSLSRDQTLGEAYLAFSQFLAKLKCGHAYCNFFNQPDEVDRALLKNANRVPFHFRWLEGRMIITENRSAQSELGPGTEVISINGASTQGLLKKLMTVARADGSNDAKRTRDLDVSAGAKFEAFDIYLPLVLKNVTSQFSLTVRNPRSQAKASIKVPALTYEQRIAPLQASLEKFTTAQPVWDWSQLDPKTVYLRMDGWSLYNSKWKWEDWLNARLDELAAKQVENLVIDIRGNEGGLDCGNPILSRLIATDLPISQLQAYVRYKSVPADLNPYLDTWDNSFRDWGVFASPATVPAAVKQGGQKFFRLRRFDDGARGQVIKARGPRFLGKVYVLVDAVCSSATFQFAKILKKNRLATLVGEPTGGNQRGINGGAFFFLRLPYSKIEMDLPLIASFPPDTQPLPPDAGVVPDVVVRTMAQDVMNGTDPQLAAVKRMILNSRKGIERQQCE